MDNQTSFYSSLPAVFTRDGLAARLSGKQSGFNVDKWLRHAVATQQALQVADTDIYATRQTERTDFSYAIATLLAPDAAIAYHTALDFVGESHSFFWTRYYACTNPKPPFTFQGHAFTGVPYPSVLQNKGQTQWGVKNYELEAGLVRCTNWERTLVDMLHTPKYGGDWEEIWHCLEDLYPCDLDAVIHYALLLEDAYLNAKLGYFLERYGDRFGTDKRHLSALQQALPSEPCRLGQAPITEYAWMPRWNLYVTHEINECLWEDPTLHIPTLV